MLSIENLSLRIAGRLLLDQASAQIQDGSRVGLVGRNGTGKTTLFSAITGDLAPEQGKITLPARASMGRLSQEAPDGPEPLIEVVLAADKERTRLLIEAETARDPHRIAEIQTRLADMDAHAAPARAASILAGLGFSEEAQSRPCSEFSGGWRMRVALAALLFSQPDLLLLDEPTNYLDLEGAMWLETFLAKYPYTVIIISHDRDLLDTAVDWILHLDRTKLTLYRGGYSAFERQRRERQTLDVKFVKRQQAERKRLTAFIERFRAKATKARQAQSRMKLLAKMEPAPEIVADEVRPIEIPSPARLLSPPIIAIDDASIGYFADTPVLRRLTLRVDPDDRIALLGSNGNGKSTLAKLLAGRLAPMSGGIVRADKLQVGYFAQHQLDELHENESSYDHVRSLMRDAPEAKVRARVGRIGFSRDAANVAVSKLSGGEKARLLLGLATFNHPHLVLLDEPTNHLDIQARNALIEAINEYTGAVILISHDRYLIEACADRLWLVANGGVTPFDGDLDDYRRQVLSDNSSARANTDSKTARTSRNVLRRAAAGKRAELAPLRKRLDGLDKTIAQRNREIAKLDAALAEPGLYDRDPARGAQLAKQRTEAVGVLAKAEDDWLTLSQQYDSAIAAE